MKIVQSYQDAAAGPGWLVGDVPCLLNGMPVPAFLRQSAITSQEPEQPQPTYRLVGSVY
jgi:hypothetical protein